MGHGRRARYGWASVGPLVCLFSVLSSAHTGTPPGQTLPASVSAAAPSSRLIWRLLPGRPLPNPGAAHAAAAPRPAVVSPRRLALLPVPAASVLLRPPRRPRHLPTTAHSVQAPDLLPAAEGLLLACLRLAVLLTAVLPRPLECCCALLSGWLPAACLKKTLAAGVEKSSPIGLKRVWLFVACLQDLIH
jgi:hypothetical protein